jgi:hypothetical protein
MADDIHLQRGIAGEQLGDLVDGRLGIRLDTELAVSKLMP